MKEAYYLLDLLFAENTHNATSLLLVAVLVHTHCSSMREKTSSINQYFSNPISAECFDRSIFWRYFHYWSLSLSQKKGQSLNTWQRGTVLCTNDKKKNMLLLGSGWIWYLADSQMHLKNLAFCPVLLSRQNRNSSWQNEFFWAERRGIWHLRSC